ncbi:MAG: HIT domain-containing protein [Deltaproteobacteria bacterium]|nr:HIT domain-containing protein [Deltaproteobacteria bacterium]MBM4323347.1 HIT domain-containing protein [Deltaproteobacteria bacterium]
MKHLWAPWRMSYILKGNKRKECIFCLAKRTAKDRENLVLHRGKYAFVMMNRYPYNNGHLMIVPHRHCINLESLSPLESKDLFELLKISIQVLKTTLSPHGFNIGVNIGKIGGAGEKHVHFHVVPRWAGDTNFMPILGETKIVPEYLVNTYQKLRSAFTIHLKKKRQKREEKE